MEILQGLLDNLTALLAAHPLAGEWYMAFVRFLFPALAVLILYRAVRSLLRIPHTPENWGQLSLPNGTSLPLTHWENILGRSGASDVVLGYPTVSRQHAALIRAEDDRWAVYDLDSKGGVALNGRTVEGSAPVAYGDVLSLGGVETVLLPVPPEDQARRRQSRQDRERPVSPWTGLFFLTLFQVLTAGQLMAAAGADAPLAIPAAFFCLIAVMWGYFLAMRAVRRVGFEMETIAFFPPPSPWPSPPPLPRRTSSSSSSPCCWGCAFSWCWASFFETWTG